MANQSLPVASSAVPTNNGTAPVKSVDDLTNQFFVEVESVPTPPIEVPLGDVVKPTQSPITPLPATDPMGLVTQNQIDKSKVQQDLENIEKDIDNAALPDGVSAESQSALKSIKTRYKNQIKEYRKNYTDLEQEVQTLRTKYAEVEKLIPEAKKAKDAQTLANSLQQEIEIIKRERDENSVFRKKYDLENDPQIKQAYTSPMQEYRKKALEIITNTGLEENFWSELINAETDYHVNALIDDNHIRGLNAQSLKDYLSQYKQLKYEFGQISSPDYIDAAIQRAKGKSLQVSQQMADDVFNSMKTAFAKHVNELQQSDVNKEHNFFVYDQVIEKATNNFTALRKTLGPDYQGESILATLAQASLMTAAYPFQNKLVNHLIKQNAEMAKELSEAKSGPVIRQTKEVQQNNNLNTYDDIQKISKKSVDQLTDEFFSS